MDVIFGVSGLRGVVGNGLTPELICNYVSSFANEIPPGTVVIGNDSRISSSMVKNAVVSSLKSLGLILDIGITPTPLYSLLLRKNASGGITITVAIIQKLERLKILEVVIFFNEKDHTIKNLEKKILNFKLRQTWKID